jgi:hypothetical protein
MEYDANNLGVLELVERLEKKKLNKHVEKEVAKVKKEFVLDPHRQDEYCGDNIFNISETE